MSPRSLRICRELRRRLKGTAPRVSPGQLAFDFDLPMPKLPMVTNFDLHGRTQIDLELQSMGLAIDRHQMERFYPLFRELGVTPVHTLLDLPGGSDILVAGVWRATNTPPMRSGRRTVFVTLDDGTGLCNLVFFPDAQERINNRVFRTNYMLVCGTTRRSGARGISVTGHGVGSARTPRPVGRTARSYARCGVRTDPHADSNIDKYLHINTGGTPFTHGYLTPPTAGTLAPRTGTAIR